MKGGRPLRTGHTVSLTGIKPTGELHLGNYIGAIQPALELIQKHNTSLYFIANYHALIALKDRAKMKEYTYKCAATWLALGLNPQTSIFYKQSDIPEIFELAWILSCHTPKGLMNRAHAYKAAREANTHGERDPDADVNIGLFTYPILMAADILLFQTNVVPVGKDQLQHVEIARHIAHTFNRLYGPTFVVPTSVVQEIDAVVPGLDGRKMSKSYHNTLPIFADDDTLKKLIFKIKTDSLPPQVPKNTEESIIFSIYRSIATEQQTIDMKQKYANGIGWGEAKQHLYTLFIDSFKEPRERYVQFLADQQYIDDVLADGANKARQIARRTLEHVKQKLGIN